jgi:hypothetical protein
MGTYIPFKGQILVNLGVHGNVPTGIRTLKHTFVDIREFKAHRQG